MEVHLLDFVGDLYGHELEITFGRLLRREQKFPSLEALRTQIQRDIAAARAQAAAGFIGDSGLTTSSSLH